jgi:23S rRNA (uracil1939-C5)-methyltransferase
MEAVPHLKGVLRRTANSSRESLQTIAGRDWLEEEVLNLRLRAAADGFFQINTALTPVLVDTALNMAEPEKGQHALDLYCGVGLFSLALAQRGARVSGVEANAAAIRQARGNANSNNLQADFYVGDAARALRRPQFATKTWHLILLDPPRAGAAECVPSLLRLRPRRIVYVSCDPATLARDVKSLVKGGYQLQSAVPLDLFPQTAHVETVVRLDDTA